MAKQRLIGKKKNRKLIYAIAVIGIIFILIINGLFNRKTKRISAVEPEGDTNTIRNEMVTKNIQQMREHQRMEYYFSMFIEKIERKQYQEAYNMLYDEFKKNYFPDLNSFIEYAEKTFPQDIGITQKNIERNGEVYVLWIEMYDIFLGKKQAKEMNIVIKENDYNDFKLSFSVI